MRYKSIDPRLFTKNRKKISKQIEPKSVVILHANDEMPRNGDQYYPYRQNSDFFYFTGIEQEKSILILCPDHPVKKNREILFLLQPNVTLEIWQGHKLTKEEARQISGIQNIQWLADFEYLLSDILTFCENIYANSNENPKFHPEVKSRDYRKLQELKKEFPLHHYKRFAKVMGEMRAVKEKEEIDLMKQACHITKKAFHRVLTTVKPGMYEYEVEAEITYEFIKNGAAGHAYAPIIGSGKNACALHYIDNHKKCKEGELLLMDFGAEYANYAADCTRTIPVNGRFSEKQKTYYQSVLRVLKKAQKLLVPGTTINAVNKKVNQLMEEEMIALGLFTRKDVESQNPDSPMYFKYFMHGTSHFIGLDVHDVGTKEMKLKKGMVLSCEPGLYIAEENIGIRLENDILVDENPVNLMEEIPIEIEDIEKQMKS